ncbi:hypothetical protein SDC9_164297 [bioreactor metagenome]|uniref:Uncharacterized protein n=1 Tax=bioreactor metagenome TaxID=1076179 RepID=A0A645FR62_9ZZZZ|nr:hypothetical protein [Oscillospiraceae bacterium]
MEENYKDIPQTPQEANMSEIHHRYFIVLVIIVIFAGVFSYSTPASMTKMLHTHEDGVTPMTYAVVSENGEGTVASVPEDVETLIAGAKCKHMVQQDADIAEGCVVFFPSEDTDYGVVFFPDGSGYTYSRSAMKLRGKVIDDDGTIYYAVSALKGAD